MVENSELLWRQYELHVELYKHYLKIILECNVFYYAITGAIVSYFLAHSSEPLMRAALLLPVAMSVLLAGLFGYGAFLMRDSRAEVFKIRDALGLHSAPETGVLIAALGVFSALMVVVAIGLVTLMCAR